MPVNHTKRGVKFTVHIEIYISVKRGEFISFFIFYMSWTLQMVKMNAYITDLPFQSCLDL